MTGETEAPGECFDPAPPARYLSHATMGVPVAACDPLLLDAPALRALASDPVVRRGIAYFEQHRVTDLGWDGPRLWANVEGSRPDHPYCVQITAEDGELSIDCDCPFDWEPACKHAVAILLAYTAQQPVADLDVAGAADEAVAARIKRGRSEVVVEHAGGDAWFGTWSAWSLRNGQKGRRYQVQIRSVSERLNHCTCPDFAVNRLGTCKHVEAVLHGLRKDAARFAEVRRDGPPVAAAQVAWDVPDAPAVRVTLPRHPDPHLRALVEAHTDAGGTLRGALPDAVHRLVEAARGRADLQIGEDVLDLARRRSEQAAQALRASHIRREVRGTGGHLPGVHTRLYPYQVDGVAFLAGCGRALLADDMGLGKTLQAIAAAAWLTEHDQVRRTLVVCPASLKHQWAREIDRFTGHRAVVVQGNPRARLGLYRERAAFTIVNYELVLRDQSVIQHEVAPDLLVLDEAQRIKNWRTKTATAIKALDTRYAFVLTGTPLENRLEDLYSLMQVVDPRVLGPLWRYLVDFHVTDERGKVLGYRNLSELRRRLAPVMLRRDRHLVREQLPDRIQHRLDLPLDRRQRELHDGALSSAAAIVQRANREHRPLTPSEEHRLLAALQSARMACDAAGLVDGETQGSPKLTELARLLEELCVDADHKVVVFSQWRRMTEMAGDVARQLGLGVVDLHGGVPTAGRGALIERFETDPQARVFLSTDAGATGLNLQCASALINLDMPYNPAILEQRIARIHRLGQDQAVQVFLLVASEAYEARVAQLVQSKRLLFDNVVSEDTTDDAVGITRQSLATALEALQPTRGEAPETTSEAAEAEPPAPTTDDVERAPEPSPREPEAESLDHVVTALQRALGDRIERMVISGGGLVLVVDRVDDQAHAAAEAHEDLVPVAVVDGRTAAALTRLGSLAGPPVYQRPPAPAVSPNVALARRKLRAAATLGAAGCDGEALGLALAGLLLAWAVRAGEDDAPEGHEALRWVLGTLVPQGVVDADEALLVGAATAFAGSESPPKELVPRVLEAAHEALMAETPHPAALEP